MLQGQGGGRLFGTSGSLCKEWILIPKSDIKHSDKVLFKLFDVYFKQCLLNVLHEMNNADNKRSVSFVQATRVSESHDITKNI